jgi:preprotein translocase subunit YajC
MGWLMLLLADGEGAPQGGPPMLAQFFPFIIVLVVMFIMMGRTSARQRREAAAMLANLQKNDKVITNSGIIGIVVAINDDEVTLRADETTNTRIRVLKSSIGRVITEEQQKQQQAAQTAQTAGSKTT